MFSCSTVKTRAWIQANLKKLKSLCQVSSLFQGQMSSSKQAPWGWGLFGLGTQNQPAPAQNLTSAKPAFPCCSWPAPRSCSVCNWLDRQPFILLPMPTHLPALESRPCCLSSTVSRSVPGVDCCLFAGRSLQFKVDQLQGHQSERELCYSLSQSPNLN